MVTFSHTVSASGLIVPALRITGIGDVYDGTLDPLTGKMIVRSKLLTKDLTTAVYGNISTGATRYYRTEVTDISGIGGYYLYSNKWNATLISNLSSDVGIWNANANGSYWLYIRPANVTSITTADQFRAYLKTLGTIQVVYGLRSSVTHYLTTAQLQEAIDQLGIKNPSSLELRRRLIMDAPHQETRTGSQITFKSVPSDLEKCEIVLDYKQSGTGDPAPDNIRPISANRNAEFFSSGKNLFGGVQWVYEIRQNIATPTWDKENENINFASSVLCTPMLKGAFKPNTRYTFILTYGKSSGTGSNLRWYYTDGTYGAPQTIDSANVGDNKKQTTVSTTAAGKTIDYIIKYQSAGRTYLYYNESGIFEGVATADDFEEYKGTIVRDVWGFDIADNVLAQGTYSAASGATTSSSLRVRTNTYGFVNAGTYTVGSDQNYLFNVYVYNTDFEYLVDESLT